MPLTSVYPRQHQIQAWCCEMPQDMPEEDAQATCSHQQQAAHGPSTTSENSPWFHVLEQPSLLRYAVQHSQVLSLSPRSLLLSQCKALPQPSAKISYQSALEAVDVILYTAASEVHPLSANIYMRNLW